jgi:acyl-CoA synthetase (NDP forming)
VIDWARGQGFGLSRLASLGNQVDVTETDLLAPVAEDDYTRVITLYLEGVSDGRHFLEQARKVSRIKPIVALKSGRTEEGARATFSHTGAMAGPDALYDGVFRQCGVIRADSIPELFDFCWILGNCRRPKGNRVIIQTHSGGPGAAAADACSRNGLQLPRFSEETLAKLAVLVPHTGSVNNPVDLTFSKNPMDYFADVPDALLTETAADGLLIYVLTPRQLIRRTMESMAMAPDQIATRMEKLFADQADSLAALSHKHQKPIAGFTFQSPENLFVQKLIEHGVPVFPSPERAARAMAALVSYAHALDAR